MLVHLNEDEMVAMIDNSSDNTDDPLKKNELPISAFDIHHKTISNGNRSNRISTTSFDIRCNPKESSILKMLLARFSDDHNNNFAFIPYGLLQMMNSKRYRRQIIFQNNFVASMVIIPIYGVTKTEMVDKVKTKLLQVTDFSGVEETHLSLDKGKSLVVTKQSYKEQV